ncbi:DUF4238 domain-containing protein [Pseudomonas laurylsulfatiphila]|uniref:DUF4238 domain-containing protein n=1 Tax=Pseudomonas laurylsulfatiphila TaxID=2011015 RepID=UPI003D21BA6B|nr:hypothetical protein [Pseudomonas reinekei]
MQKDLYTTKFGDFESTEIEEKFFGDIDVRGKKAVEYFSDFVHPSVDHDAFLDLMLYLSTQKLRTPKGLKYLSLAAKSGDKNALLFAIQRLKNMFCAIWAECIWQLADCKKTKTKLILSDHPVTVYNMGCYPQSSLAREMGDPEVWSNGTHTYFPLSEDRVLILTNLSWLRNPYGNPMKERPNPVLFRQAIFNFMDIQTHRDLSELEVQQINYITKTRAQRYIAARCKEWLYPELSLGSSNWPDFGSSYLFMPDPRSASYSTEMMFGFEDGSSLALDEYGRKPSQLGYSGSKNSSRPDWESFHAFQGEYARLFGPVRRGRSFNYSRLSIAEDSDDFHAYHLKQEQKYQKRRYKP